jgi:hypothetical protein
LIHCQVLFIDADDVLRGRLAAGLFERVAEWNGYGRVLLPWTCGVDADQGGQAGDLSTQVRGRSPPAPRGSAPTAAPLVPPPGGPALLPLAD